jgi:predicted esterase
MGTSPIGNAALLDSVRDAGLVYTIAWSCDLTALRRTPWLTLPLTLLALQCDPAPPASSSTQSSAPAAAPARQPAPAPSPARPSSPAVPSPAPVTAPPEPPGEIATDWCIRDVSVLDEQTCYVLPERPSSSLVIYLHGIVPPTAASPHKTRLESILANAARRDGFAALLPRGLQGYAGSKHPGWWGWPTDDASFRKQVSTLTARFSASRHALERRTGRPFEKIYLAGSSAGAYFVALVVLHGSMRADGYGIMSGGSGHAGAAFETRRTAPLYAGFGTYDSVGPSARAFAESVRKRGWPVCVRAHALGHGAKEVYLDEAIAFWKNPRDCPR